MEKKKPKNAFQQDPDTKYVGNVFGWKVSLIGLGFILFFIGLYFVSLYYNGNSSDIPNIENESILITPEPTK